MNQRQRNTVALWMVVMFLALCLGAMVYRACQETERERLERIQKLIKEYQRIDRERTERERRNR